MTSAAEASAATDAGADALVVQGFEAGGHRGSHEPGAPADVGLLALLQLVREVTELPLVATGGIATGRGVAAVLAAGAAAAQLGTAFMLTPEAATSPAHREALRGGGQTAVTRAFTGRPARGIENRFMREHESDAPLAYPEVHNLTAPVRAAARDGRRRGRLQPLGRAGARPGRRAARGRAGEAAGRGGARRARVSRRSPRSSAGTWW